MAQSTSSVLSLLTPQSVSGDVIATFPSAKSTVKWFVPYFAYTALSSAEMLESMMVAEEFEEG